MFNFSLVVFSRGSESVVRCPDSYTVAMWGWVDGYALRAAVSRLCDFDSGP